MSIGELGRPDGASSSSFTGAEDGKVVSTRGHASEGATFRQVNFAPIHHCRAVRINVRNPSA